MTMMQQDQAAEEQAIRPPPYYWLSRVMAERRADAAKHVVNGIDKAADEFAGKLDVQQRALGLIRQRDPRKRLDAYYAKPDTFLEASALFAAGELMVVYSWESQQAYFPRDYEQDNEDFLKLRERASKGDFGYDYQLKEMSYSMVTREPQNEPDADVSAMPEDNEIANGASGFQSSDDLSQPDPQAGSEDFSGGI